MTSVTRDVCVNTDCLHITPTTIGLYQGVDGVDRLLGCSIAVPGSIHVYCVSRVHRRFIEIWRQ